MLYNPQLDTFLAVADAGSFNKAAELMFVTPSAVIKQINLLEEDLGILLFERTHRGLKLTEAGKVFYNETKHIIDVCEHARYRAKDASENKELVIRIGTSPMTPPNFLMKIWPKIHACDPKLKLEFVPFDNTPRKAAEILKNLGKDIDVVSGIFDPTLLEIRKCDGTVISHEPICIVVSLNHPLAQFDVITPDQLIGQKVHILEQGRMKAMDDVRLGLLEHDVQMESFSFYSTEIFNEVENTSDVLIAIQKWENVHPLLKIIRVDWEYTAPFGILHAYEPEEKVLRFIDAMRHIMS